MYEEDWEGVSEEAKLFVRRILVKTPEFRMNLDQMLNHKWITPDMDSDAAGVEEEEKDTDELTDEGLSD